MRVRLLCPDRDFDPAAPLPPMAERLAADLGLPDLWAAMANGDRYLHEVASKVMLASLVEPAEIEYRQQVLRDWLSQPQVLADMYRLSVAAVEGERKVWGLIGRHPAGALHRAVEVLGVLVPVLRELRDVAASARGGFASPGLRRLATTLQRELDEPYLGKVTMHLRELRLDEGLLFTAGLGPGNRAVGYVLRRQTRGRGGWTERLGLPDRSQLSFRIAPRDEAGFRALAEINDRALNATADAVAQACDHVVSFAGALRWELAFYLGCLNLHGRISARGLPTCWPRPEAAAAGRFRARGLYDLGLAFRREEPLVGNDLTCDDRPLLVITGANSGGKSTMLRGLGLAQLMFQAGMFVGGEGVRASPVAGVFTHFVAAEDEGTGRGKLAEELDRMSQIVDLVGPGALVLMNESFAATNEREGSEIASQVVRALLEAGIRVALVTHFFELADGFRRVPAAPTLFLRAERAENGSRTYRLPEGLPLPTTYGTDLVGRLTQGGDRRKVRPVPRRSGPSAG